MKKIAGSLVVVTMGGISASMASVPADIVKVTGETKAACVEYVDYQGEMYCTTKALSKEPVDPNIKQYETWIIHFDDQPWLAAWGKMTEDVSMVEYVPKGDDINNWHELVTSQFFPGLENKVTPKEFAEMTVENLKKAGYAPIVTYHQTTPDGVIFEYRIEKPEAQKVDELQYIRTGKNGLYILHYAVKDTDMGAEKRAQWVKNLSESKIKSDH